MGLPWVDEYLRLRGETAEYDELRIQLVGAQDRQKQLDRINTKITAQLDQATARAINPNDANHVREQLVEFVRGAGGRMRRLEIGERQTRRWAASGDDPTYDSIPIDQQESDFVLHTHGVELQAEGSLSAVRNMIQNIMSQGWLMKTESLTVIPTGIEQSPIKLEIRFLLFGLSPVDQDPEQEFALHGEPNTHL